MRGVGYAAVRSKDLSHTCPYRRARKQWSVEHFASTVALTGALMIAATGPAAAAATLSIGTARIAGTAPTSPPNVEFTYTCEPGQANRLTVVADIGDIDGEVRKGFADPICDDESETTTVAVQSFADSGGT